MLPVCFLHTGATDFLMLGHLRAWKYIVLVMSNEVSQNNRNILFCLNWRCWLKPKTLYPFMCQRYCWGSILNSKRNVKITGTLILIWCCASLKNQITRPYSQCRKVNILLFTPSVSLYICLCQDMIQLFPISAWRITFQTSQ